VFGLDSSFNPALDSYSFQFGDSAFVVHVPIGFQYDIPIRSVRGLYLYPRFQFGFSFESIDTFNCGVFNRQFQCSRGFLPA
jgi:hypothetical protein